MGRLWTSFHGLRGTGKFFVCNLLSRNKLLRDMPWNADVHITFPNPGNIRGTDGSGILESGIVIGFVHKLFTAAFVSLAGRGGAWERRILLSRFFPSWA